MDVITSIDDTRAAIVGIPCLCGKRFIRRPERRDMPSKRDLIGSPPASTGVEWAQLQWTRISAFVAGVGIAIGVLWLPALIEAGIPSVVTAGLVVGSVGLVYYGWTTRTWQEAGQLCVGLGVGELLSMFLL